MLLYVHQVFVLCIMAVVAVKVEEHISLTLGEASTLQTVECGKFKYFKVDVTDPCRDLRVTVNPTGTGEPDLYISKGKEKYPTESSLAWTSYEWGPDNLTISSWDPEFEVGTFYIGVHGYCGDDVSSAFTQTQFDILAESVPTTHRHTEITLGQPVLNEKVDAEAYKFYRFCVPDKCTRVGLKLDSCIDPTACPMTYGYPEMLVSRSIVKPTINDHSWKLATVVRRSILLEHDNPDVAPGHYFVSVYGWCTPDQHCSDKSTCGPCDYVPNMPYNVTLIMSHVGGCDPNAATPDPCSGSNIITPSSLLDFLIIFCVILILRDEC